MKNNELPQRIKSLRSRKGYSQEELAERTGLSLRTIQRIENGETEPRGDSLKRLADAFDVPPDEIVDWAIQEDKGFITSLNLSALSFIIFPLLGILIPLIMWISRKDKIRNINEISKSLLNFQITWTLFLFIGYAVILGSMYYRINSEGDISPAIIHSRVMVNLLFIGIMYLYNLVVVVINSVRINNEKKVCYFPQVRFLGK